MRLIVHSQDRALVRQLADASLCQDHDVTVTGTAQVLSGTVAVLDARSFSLEKLHEALLDPTVFGDVILILVGSYEAMLHACDITKGLKNIDFLVWPTSLRLLVTRVRLLAAGDETTSPLARRERERQLKAFRGLTNNLPVMIVTTGVDGRALFLNAAARRFAGANEAAMENLGWWGVTHPEYRDALRRKVQYAVAHRESINETVLMAGSDRTWHLVSIVARPHYDAEGIFAGMVSLAHEVSEQDQTEDSLIKSKQRFKQLANMAPLLIWHANDEGSLIYANERWHAYTGRMDLPLGWDDWMRLVHEDDHDRILELYRQSIRSCSEIQLECRIREKSGAYRWFAVFSTPIRNHTGKITKWLGSAMDIDARKQNAEELERLYAEMERKRQAKDHFLAALSHELRTPLNIITGYAHLLLETLALGPVESASLQVIEEDSRRILALVERLPWQGLTAIHPLGEECDLNDAH